MLLNVNQPLKFDKIYDKTGKSVNISFLEPGDKIDCTFLLKKRLWRDKSNNYKVRNRKLSDLWMMSVGSGRDKLKLDISIYLYYKTIDNNYTFNKSESDKTNKVKMISFIKNIWTDSIDYKHNIDLIVPEYSSCDKSKIIFDKTVSLIISLSRTGIGATFEDDVEIEDIVIKTDKIVIDRMEIGNGIGNSGYCTCTDKVINFFQTIDKLSGYGMHGSGIVDEISKGIGIDLGWNVRDICKDSKNRISDIEMVGLKSKISLILNIPKTWFKAINSKYTVGYSMFESSKIPSTWISGCNRVDRIFVPIVSNVEAFRSSGVKEDIPIDVIPTGVNTEVYNPKRFVKENFKRFDKLDGSTFKFLIVNNNQSRKNNRMVIQAIGEEFEKEISEKKVILVTRLCYGKKLIKDEWVYHIMGYLKDGDEMAKLINSCDCIVSMSSGECGDIPILQGMAMEKSVIISEDKLIHTEIMDEGEKMFGRVGNNNDDKNMNRGVAFPVKIGWWERAYYNGEYRNNPYFAGLDDTAIWVVPDYDDLRRKLRYVYDNRNDSERIGQIRSNARKYILEKRTVRVAVKKMVDIFNTLE